MNIRVIGAAVLAGAMVAGCGKDAVEDEKLLSVNGEVLTRAALEADVEAIIKAQGGDKMPADKQSFMRQTVQNQIAQGFVVEKVLVAKAKAAGFQVTDADLKAREGDLLKAMARMPDAPKTIDEYFKKFPLGEARARAMFADQILIEKMFKVEQQKQPPVDFAAKADDIIRGIVSNNTSVAASEKAALAKIRGFKALLDKTPAVEVPKKFAELAKANSDCPSSAKGGDLGEFTHGQMVKEFDEVAFKLPVNKVSEPVKTQFGYHLVMTTKKIPAVAAKGDSPAEPEKVQASHILVKAAGAQPVPKKEDVVNNLKRQAERMFAQEFVAKSIKAAKIEAFDDEFKQFVPQDETPAAPVEKPTKK